MVTANTPVTASQSVVLVSLGRRCAHTIATASATVGTKRHGARASHPSVCTSLPTCSARHCAKSSVKTHRASILFADDLVWEAATKTIARDAADGRQETDVSQRAREWMTHHHVDTFLTARF
jgi:hypothetical protein